MKSYGKELILDLHECDVNTFNRESIQKWLEGLCELIDMEREDLHFWDYKDCSDEEIKDVPAHLLGTTAIQFISTSDIRIHSLDILKECYINIFSCKEFDCNIAREFTYKWFRAKDYVAHIITRGSKSKV